MAPTISVTPEYILVSPGPGMDYWEIVETIGRLFAMPAYHERNDLWLFRDGPLGLLFTDLERLGLAAARIYPAKARGTRTALVCTTGLQQCLAELFVGACRCRHRRIRVFPEFDAARRWVMVRESAEPISG